MKIIDRDVYSFLYGKKKAREIIGKNLKVKQKLTVIIPVVIMLMVFLKMDFIQIISAAILVAGIIWVIPEVHLKQKCKVLKMEYKLGLPDFLDVTALLLEAGRPLWYAIKQSAETGGSSLCKRIKDALETEGSMEEGHNPEALFGKLAEELKVPEISSSVSVIIQNSRKGERELASVLRMQSSILRQERRLIAQELGNKTSNLLLIPSGMVFIAVLAMLITPAIVELGLF